MNENTPNPFSEPTPTDLHSPSAMQATGSDRPVVTASRVDPEQPYPDLSSDYYLPTRPRKKILPLVLFVLTCISTFYVGISLWSPLGPLMTALNTFSLMHIRKLALLNWDIGLTYMVTVILILFLHEMGHFVATLYYRVQLRFRFFFRSLSIRLARSVR